MKTTSIALVVFSSAVLIYFSYLGYKSNTGSSPGLLNDKLAPCPKSPNCICTEFSDDASHYVQAIDYGGKSSTHIVNIIKYLGGTILIQENNYIAATFTSGIFQYVDDFEVRTDMQHRIIHLRSASRVGIFDMNKNLKRVLKFRDVYLSHD